MSISKSIVLVIVIIIIMIIAEYHDEDVDKVDYYMEITYDVVSSNLFCRPN